jgi:hypothetical protein
MLTEPLPAMVNRLPDTVTTLELELENARGRFEVVVAGNVMVDTLP